MPRRHRTGKSSRRRVIREIKKTGLITIGVMFSGAFILAIGWKLWLFTDNNDRGLAEKYFHEAKPLIEENNYRAARVILKKAVQSDTSWPAAKIELANVNLMLFDAADAKSELLSVREMDVDSGRIDYLLGKAYWLLGEYDKAKTELTSDNIGSESYTNAQRILGRTLLEAGDIDGSRQAFDRAVEKSPEDSMLWTDIARFRFVLGDQKAAIEAVEYAVKLDEKNIRALEFRGRMVRSQFGLLAALPWFERALEINPDDIPVMIEYATTLGDAGLATEMLEVSREILELEPQSGIAYYMQATIAARARNYKLARRLLNQAGDRQNGLPAGLLLSAIIEYELQNYNLAIKKFRKLLGLQPNNKTALKLLSASHYRAGEYNEANENITRYINKHGPDSYSNIIAARVLEALDKRSEAAIYLNRVIQNQAAGISLVREDNNFYEIQSVALKNPDRADLIIPYIRALLERDNKVGALNLATSLLSKNKGVADAHILVGDIQIRNNNISAALKHFNDARAIKFEQSLMLRLVDAYRRAQNFDAARETLLSYLSNNPRDIMAQKLIADTYMELGNAAQAIFWLESIKDRIGYNDTIILTKLARSYVAYDRLDDAVKIAKIAYEINPLNVDTTRVYGYTLLEQGVNGKAAVELLEKAQKLLPDDEGIGQELEQALNLREIIEEEEEEERRA